MPSEASYLQRAPFSLEERFNALCEILGELERDGCEPWSVNATTALCHARTIAEDVLEDEKPRSRGTSR